MTNKKSENGQREQDGREPGWKGHIEEDDDWRGHQRLGQLQPGGGGQLRQDDDDMDEKEDSNKEKEEVSDQGKKEEEGMKEVDNYD